PITDALHEGENLIAVRFDSVYELAEAERARLGPLPNQYPEPFNYVRKMACNFGWDWGPTLVTAGIWRAVTLVRQRGPRLGQVRPLVSVDGGRGVARFEVELDSTWDNAMVVEAHVDCVRASSRVEPGQTTATVEVVLDQPRLWWPVGLGSPDRYEATIRL